MGIWSSNNSIGNILGQQTAAVLQTVTSLSWEYVLIITTSYIFLSSLFILIIKDKPSPLLLKQNQNLQLSLNEEDSKEVEKSTSASKQGISFKAAIQIPG